MTRLDVFRIVAKERGEDDASLEHRIALMLAMFPRLKGHMEETIPPEREADTLSACRLGFVLAATMDKDLAISRLSQRFGEPANKDN